MSSVLDFLAPFAEQSFERSNIVSLSGRPAPGKWRVPPSSYGTFIELLSEEIHPDRPFYFVERRLEEIPLSRVALDIDAKIALQTEDYHKIFEAIFQFFSTDDEVMMVLSASTPTKHSYHIVCPETYATVEDQHNFAKLLKKTLHKPLADSVDLGIYAYGGSPGLRMAFSTKPSENRPLLPHWAFYRENGGIMMQDAMTLPNFLVLKQTSLQHGLTEDTEPTPLVDQIDPDSFCNFDQIQQDDFLDNLKAKICKNYHCEIRKTGEKGEGYEKNVFFHLNATNCLINDQAPHSRSDGRAIYINVKGAFYCCLNTKCKGKTIRLPELSTKDIKDFYGLEDSPSVQGTPQRDGSESPKPKKRKNPPRAASAPKKQKPVVVDLASEDSMDIQKSDGDFFDLMEGLRVVAAAMKLYRLDKDVYTEVILQHGDNNDPIHTGYWARKDSISRFVMKTASMPENPNLYKLRISKGNYTTRAIAELTEGYYTELPELETERELVSFTNGQYNLVTYEFEPHSTVPHERRSAFYIDQEVEEEWLKPDVAKTLETPFSDSLLTYQELTPGQIQGVYYLIGQLLHEKGKYDKHGKFGYIYGLSGVGKSILANLLKGLFPRGSIGVLQGDSSKTFALEPLLGKMVVYTPDMDKNPKTMLPQSIFQSVVEGVDGVSVNRKNKPTIIVEKWTAPYIAFGNHKLGYESANGAIAKRAIMLHLNKPVDKETYRTDLEDLMYTERAKYMLKVNAWYFDTVARVGNKNVMDFIDPSFRETTDKHEANTDHLQQFLNDCCIFEQKMKRDKGDKTVLLVPRSQFVKHYVKFCRDFAYAAPDTSNDVLMRALEQRGVSDRRTSFTWPPPKKDPQEVKDFASAFSHSGYSTVYIGVDIRGGAWIA